MEFVAIYMRGQPIKVPTGTVLDMSLNAEEPEKKVSVKVQGIEFVVSRAMLCAQSTILAKEHFFTEALASDAHPATERTTIEITRESAVNDVSLYSICYFFYNSRKKLIFYIKFIQILNSTI